MKATTLLPNLGQSLWRCRWLILGTSYPGAALVVGPVLIVGPDGVCPVAIESPRASMKTQPEITSFLKADRPEKILIINCGSSSLKYTFYDTEDETRNARGQVERIMTVLVVPTDEELMMAREALRVKGRVE